jgi:hypothetical protein
VLGSVARDGNNVATAEVLFPSLCKRADGLVSMHHRCLGTGKVTVLEAEDKVSLLMSLARFAWSVGKNRKGQIILVPEVESP